MAASYSDTRLFNVPVQAMINLFRSPFFISSLRYKFNGEYPSPYYTVFNFTHGVSLASWGEKITVNVSVLQNNTVSVTVTSECSESFQFVDWGKNNDNVHAIFTFIYTHIGGFVNALGPM